MDLSEIGLNCLMCQAMGFCYNVCMDIWNPFNTKSLFQQLPAVQERSCAVELVG
jgi:hypothetical protein